MAWQVCVEMIILLCLTAGNGTLRFSPISKLAIGVCLPLDIQEDGQDVEKVYTRLEGGKE